jgi:hypothetical protein
LKRVILRRFFIWLYHPNDTPKKRKLPAVMENIPKLERREQSIYKPPTKGIDVIMQFLGIQVADHMRS